MEGTIPDAAEGIRDPLAIEPLADGERARPGGIFGKDPAPDSCLAWLEGAQPAVELPVVVRPADEPITRYCVALIRDGVQGRLASEVELESSQVGG